MTDRELLLAAAKAAGNPQGRHVSLGGLLMANDLYWNPLIDDGDALRLAVSLKLRIDFGADDAVFVGDGPGLSFDTISPEYAVRRAIVRAAAAMAA